MSRRKLLKNGRVVLGVKKKLLNNIHKQGTKFDNLFLCNLTPVCILCLHRMLLDLYNGDCPGRLLKYILKVWSQRGKKFIGDYSNREENIRQDSIISCLNAGGTG